MKSSQEKARERKAATISVAIHALLLVLFLFIMAWREPNPPIPEYGIELNFGLDATGGGDVQRTAPVNEKAVEEHESNADETIEEQNTPQNQQVVEQMNNEVTEVKPTEAVPTPLPAVTSPDFREVKEQPKESKPVEKPNTQEVKPNTQNPKPTTDNKVEKIEGKQDQKAEIVDGSQGDKKDEKGDKGDPKGSLDARALYGTPGGGGGGASLELSGWNWDYLPKPKDESQESGRLVFQITVDADGYVVGIRTLETTVSPAIEKIYRDEVSQLTFSPTRDNTRPAPTSTGRITFIIRNN